MILAQQPPPIHHNTIFDLRNYTGWKLGEFYITGKWKKSASGKMLWEHQCSCGSEPTYDLAAHVAQGRSERCKRCSQIIRAIHARDTARVGADSHNWRGCGGIPSSFLTAIKRSANHRARYVPVEITIEDLSNLWEKQEGRCAYTGFPLHFPHKRKAGTASIDRIDSSLGYTVDNIQFVHKDVNLMKQSLTEERFLALCKAIVEYNV